MADDRDHSPEPSPGTGPDPANTPDPAATTGQPAAPDQAAAPDPDFTVPAPVAAAPTHAAPTHAAPAPAPAPAPAEYSPWAAPRASDEQTAGPPPWSPQGYSPAQPPQTAYAAPSPSAQSPYTPYPYPTAAPAPRATRWQGVLLVLVAVVSCAALGLGTIAVVESRDSAAAGGIDVEELADQLVEETEASYEEEFGASGMDPDFPGYPAEGEPFSMYSCSGAEPATGPGLGPQPRSPDELNPVLDVGEAAVVSYRPLECEHPVVFRIRVDDVRVQDTAPTELAPSTPLNGQFVVVDATVEALNDCTYPDWYSMSLVGPDHSVVSPLYSESLFAYDALYPGDSASATLVFDAPVGHDLILFDDYVAGSVGWRF